MQINFLIAMAVLLLAATSRPVISMEDADAFVDNAESSESTERADPKSAEMIDLNADDSNDEGVVRVVDDQHWLNSAEAMNQVDFNDNNQEVPIDCCPSGLQLTTTNRSRNMRGETVALYKSDSVKQVFVEVLCKPGVENRPCRFMGQAISEKTKCVQKFSYAYALIVFDGRAFNESLLNKRNPKPLFPPGYDITAERYMVDYIKIRSGCGCELEQEKIRDDPVFKRLKEAAVAELRSRNGTSTS